jgi:hypothetical protein
MICDFFRAPLKAAHQIQTPLFQEGWIYPHGKCHFLLDMDFLSKEVTKITSNFTWQKNYFVSTEW